MTSVFGKLMFAAVMKRAAAMEEWRTKHLDHYPQPTLHVSSDDVFSQTMSCSCGASAVFTVVVHIDVVVTPK